MASSSTSVLATLVGIGGALGAAVSVAASALASVVSGAASALGGALAALGSALSAGISVVSSVLATLGGVLGMVAGAVTSVIGGALKAITGALGALIKGLGDALGAALQLGAGVLGGALALAGAVVFGFVKVLGSATAEMQRVAKEIASIRNNTGASLGAAQAGYNSLRGAGMSGAAASAFLGSDAMRGGQGRRIARAQGLPDPFDPRFAVALSQKAKHQNIFERDATLNSLAGDAGPDAVAQLRQIQNQRPETIREGQRFQSKTNASLGVTPEAIRQLADEFPLLQNKLSVFTEAVKNRFVASMLPAMSAGLERLTDYLQANGQNIANAIQRGVIWLYSSGPQLILDGANIGLTALEALAQGFFAMGDAVAAGLRALGGGQSGIFAVFEILASGIDSFVTLLRTLSGAFAATGAAIETMIAANPILKGVANAAGLNPQIRNPVEAFKQGQNLIPQTDLSGALGNFKNSGLLEKYADSVQGATDAGRARFATVNDTLRGVYGEAKTATGTPEERRATIEGLLTQLVANSGQMVDEQKATKDQIAKNGGVDVLGQIKNSIAGDMFRESYG